MLPLIRHIFRNVRVGPVKKMKSLYFPLMAQSYSLTLFPPSWVVVVVGGCWWYKITSFGLVTIGNIQQTSYKLRGERFFFK